MRSMFSWGEDCQRGFWRKDAPGQESRAASEDGVCHLNISYHIAGLSAGHSVLAFVKSNGNAFIIRTHENRDGRRLRGKQSEHAQHCLFLLLLLSLASRVCNLLTVCRVCEVQGED